jgi:UDP-glucose 4-epimerase
MRILITGGFGFVGGRLAVHFAQLGHQIILGTRHPLTSTDWLPQAEVAIIAWDDIAALEWASCGVDVIIHAAGMNAQDCATDPLAALAFNGLATARLVAAASQASVKKFIYLSTGHVYASPLVGTITEEICPRNLHPYATSHLAGENAVLSASSRGEFQGIVLRLSNTFGAPMQKDVNCWMLLVNDLCRQAVETRKLVLQTSGLQQRDFIGLTEVCQVTERLVTGYTELKLANIFNVGAGVSQSVLEMALLIQQRCIKVLGFEPELLRKKSESDELYPKLIYRTDHLTSLGITTKSLGNIAEVDRLLQFCQSTFNQIKCTNA